MQIAQVLAGYTLGGADLLRRAMGKKKPEEMAKQRAVFTEGAVASRRARTTRASHLRPDGEVRGLWLQQVAFRRVRAALVSDRVAEGALPGAVHGGGAVLRHGPHRQGRHAHRRMRASRAQRRAAGRELLRLCIHRQRRAHDPLRAGRGEGRRRVRRGGASSHERAARGPFASLEDLCRRLDLNRVNRACSRR